MKVLNSFGFSNFQPILGVYAFLSHWNEKKPTGPNNSEKPIETSHK
jgi:hypothetical protein